jgi:hypothetical protein
MAIMPNPPNGDLNLNFTALGLLKKRAKKANGEVLKGLLGGYDKPDVFKHSYAC